MPNLSPRIHVSFNPRTYEAVERVAIRSGMSKSSLVSDLVEHQTEVLEQLADMLEKVAELKDKMSDADYRQLCFSIMEKEHYVGSKMESARDELDHAHGEILEAHQEVAG